MAVAPFRPRRQASANSAAAYAMDSVAEPCTTRQADRGGRHGCAGAGRYPQEFRLGGTAGLQGGRGGGSGGGSAQAPAGPCTGVTHLASLGIHDLSATVLRALCQRVDDLGGHVGWHCGCCLHMLQEAQGEPAVGLRRVQLCMAWMCCRGPWQGREADERKSGREEVCRMHSRCAAAAAACAAWAVAARWVARMICLRGG